MWSRSVTASTVALTRSTAACNCKGSSLDVSLKRIRLSRHAQPSTGSLQEPLPTRSATDAERKNPCARATTLTPCEISLIITGKVNTSLMFLRALDSKSFTPAICLVPTLHSWFLGLESLSHNAGVNNDCLFNTDGN